MVVSMVEAQLPRNGWNSVFLIPPCLGVRPRLSLVLVVRGHLQAFPCGARYEVLVTVRSIVGKVGNELVAWW